MAAKSFAVSDEISILILYLLDVLGACSDDSFHRVHIPNEFDDDGAHQQCSDKSEPAPPRNVDAVTHWRAFLR